MQNAVIVDAVRTPTGRRKGKLNAWHPVDLASVTLKALIERNDFDPGLVDDVLMGCVSQVGEQGWNVGRNAALAAGFPEDVVGTTIDRQCGSSQQSSHFAAQSVMAGAYDVVIAAGVESMTRVPMGVTAQGPGQPFGPMVMDRYAHGLVPQGISAELIAEKWGLSREALDTIAYDSHMRATRATEEGRFEREIVPVDITLEDGSTELMTRDEGIRPNTTPEVLAGLKPAFKPDGVVTAGNSSQISDGSAAVLIMSEEKADDLGLTPMARFVGVLVGRSGSGDHAHRADSGNVQGAGPDRSEHRRYRPLRGQRGIRGGEWRLAGRAWRVGSGRAVGQDQRQRRRHCPWPPARMLRRQTHRHPRARARAQRKALRPPDHVRGRRHGQRHDHRKLLRHFVPRIGQQLAASSVQPERPISAAAPDFGFTAGWRLSAAS